MGRPVGVPGDAAFQTRVLLAALKLLEADAGPLLEDFPEDAPVSDTPVSTLACPVTFAGKEEDLNDLEKLAAALREEVAGLRNWYDMAVQKRGRTTFGRLDRAHLAGHQLRPAPGTGGVLRDDLLALLLEHHRQVVTQLLNVATQ